ncbi:MAG: amino-acid N-acetyltransferase [Gammaproteobacteria bacterium]|jgi:amino-acid N-acetyltransferase
MTENSSQFIKWFRSASPYIRVHKGKTFIIHIDDDAIHAGSFTDLVHDLALLNSLEIRLVIVYSTRNSIELRLNNNDASLQYHNGIRVTDANTLETVKDAAGKLRIEIESALSMGLGNTPMSNAEVITSSGNYIRAKPMGVVEGVDYLYTGTVRSVEVKAINNKLEANEIVLIPPIGYSVTGETFNLESKTLALTLATELNAEKLIYLTDISGLIDKKGKLVQQLTVLEVEAYLKSVQGTQDPIINYLINAVDACAGGVLRVHVIDRSIDGALVQELFSRDGVGTMISGTSYDDLRQASVDDISGILELIVPMEKQGVLVERSREKLELEIGNFTVMLRDDVIIGCASLYIFPDEKAAEVACMVIHPDYHNSSRGAELYSILEQNARQAKVDKIFVLTTQATHWFLELGFQEAKLDDLPVEKINLYNFKRNSKILIKKV